MILVDTSVWFSHLKIGNDHLKQLLTDGEVTTHPFIIGELACGNLKNRDEILTLLQFLPESKLASHKEVLHFIDAHKLMGTGIGYIDVHLLASVHLSGLQLWTFDKKLNEVALKMNKSYGPA